MLQQLIGEKVRLVTGTANFGVIRYNDGPDCGFRTTGARNLQIKKPRLRKTLHRGSLDVCCFLLTELVKYLEEVFADHLGIASFNVVTLHEVQQFAILEKCNTG